MAVKDFSEGSLSALSANLYMICRYMMIVTEKQIPGVLICLICKIVSVYVDNDFVMAAKEKYVVVFLSEWSLSVLSVKL